MTRAVPSHVIVRYHLSSLNFYRGWRPVEVLRFRLFENATHEEVTGEKQGAPWHHDWSCESLTLPVEGGYWRINGRNTWPTPEAALAAVSEGTFATFEEAIAEARKRAEANLDRCKKHVIEAEWALAEVCRANPPELP